MSRAVDRRYRVRFATLGANEITPSTTDFVLTVADLTAVPVIQGSFVHPLDGATEMRPLMVEVVDYAGAVTAAFAVDGRWRAIGRVVDLQWQDTNDDPDDDAAWTTYGTGRCSGFDELDGPGKYRVEVSDETWVARRAELFTAADTTQLWPAGIRYGWRGIESGGWGFATRGSSSGAAYRMDCAIGIPVPDDLQRERGVITQAVFDYAKNDMIDLDDQTHEGVNFKNLRLELDEVPYRINGFGSSVGGSIQTLDDALQAQGNSFVCWVVWEGGSQPVPPAGSSSALLYSVGPPTDNLPLHVGVRNQAWYPDHYWGTSPQSVSPPDCGGFLHPADFTRRAWEAMNIRYDSANLDAIEADVSFPLIAPYVLESPDNPHKWMQDEVWGPNMLLALRDGRGRMKLADLRPPSITTDLSAYPVLDAANSKLHRPRIVGGDLMNSAMFEFHTYDNGRILDAADWDHWPLSKIYFAGGAYVSYVQPNPSGGVIINLPTGVPSGGWPPMYAKSDGGFEGQRLDFVNRRLDTVGPLQSDNIDIVSRRERTFSAKSWMEPLSQSWIYNITKFAQAVTCATARGQIDAQVFMGQLGDYLLKVYQDGPMMLTAEISGTLAETLEEGDYVLVDCASVKIPNPFTAARFGKLLVLIVSLTRYPAHAEIEYLVVGFALRFACPDPDDSSTWLLSPLNAVASGYFRFSLPEPLSGGDLLTFYIQALKNLAGGQNVNMAVNLLLSDMTLVASWTVSGITETATDYSFSLDAGEQAIISPSDWSSLVLEITREGDVGDTDSSVWRRLIVSGIWV